MSPTNPQKKIALLVSSICMAMSSSAWAKDVYCNNTLYYCGVQPGDNVFINTTQPGGISPLQGYGVYLNSSKYNLNDLTIETTGSKSDAIRSNGNHGSFFVAQGKIDITASGSGSDGINLGAKGGPGSDPNKALNNTVILNGSEGHISADSVAVRANNNLGEGSESIIILGDNFTIEQTGTKVDNKQETAGYAVYAGNRDDDISGFGTMDWLFRGHRNNNKGDSYVFIGNNAVISSAGESSKTQKGSAVYANKGGLIQLGDNATISAPEGSYHLYAATEKQNIGTNNPGQVAEARPGTILLAGGATINQDGPSTEVVIQAKGEGSVIQSGYVDLSYTDTDTTIGTDIHASSGRFIINGGLSAIEGGTVDLAMAQGSQFKGFTTQDNDSTVNLSLSGNNSLWQMTEESTLNKLTLANGATWDVASSAADPDQKDFKLTGDVVSYGGVISLTDDHNRYQHSLTIDGNYSATNGVVKMNTEWLTPGGPNGEHSQSDVLIITGEAKGTTQVVPIGKNGEIMVIDGDIEQTKDIINTVYVVETGGASEGAFVGTIRTKGLGEAQLAQDGDHFRWTLSALKPIDPEPPIDPVIPDIISPEIPGYAQMAQANMELNYAILGTLHERVGQRQKAGQQTESPNWGRIFTKNLTLNGKNQFDQDGDMYVIQLGRDLNVAYDDQDNSRQYTGIMASYGHQEVDYFDRRSIQNGLLVGRSYTGKTKTDAATIGVYHTYYAENGQYLDLVGQVSYLRNKYRSRNHVKANQNGWGAAASAEVGRPYALAGNQWQVEPQAQLIYQYLSLDAFNDGVKSIKNNHVHGVRGRVGARLTYQQDPTQTTSPEIYGVANVWHDFTKGKSVKIDDASIKEQYNQTWGELGLGVQIPTSTHAYVYADARYEHSFDGDKREGYRGTLGFKFTW